MNNEIKRMAEISKILSNEVRMCILINLAMNEEVKVGDLQHCAKCSQSLISQQLSKLKDLKIIESRKTGLEVYYKLIDKSIKNVITKLNLIEIAINSKGE
ncbi:MAG: metalloregulator ArsR/SmtB family transcription factor [Bacilli bacterium]|nr:metalloregulator ArsR/SmtB family transcription factor [Bacilli bacterium]